MHPGAEATCGASIADIFRQQSQIVDRICPYWLLKHLSGTIASTSKQVKISTCSSFTETCPSGQVLAISERRAKFWLSSPAAFVKVNAGCKPAGSTVDVRPSGRNFS